MGGGDHCAMFGCYNSRRYPERYTIKPHVKLLKFHKPPKRGHATWERLINRLDYKVNIYTKVCSNHFVDGEPTKKNPHPSLYLKGYSSTDAVHGVKRTIYSVAQEHRDILPGRVTKQRKISLDHCYTGTKKMVFPNELNGNEPESPPRISEYTVNTMRNEHSYSCEVNDKKDMTKRTPLEVINIMAKETNILKDERDNFIDGYTKLKENFLLLEQCKGNKILNTPFCIEKLEESEEVVFKTYTGIANIDIFNWVFCHIKEKVPFLHYYRSNDSTTSKHFQNNFCKKPGPMRTLDPKNEMLLTLMRIKMNLLEEDLGFRFEISLTLVSTILSTWIPFLGFEMKALIHWPSPSEITRYYPKCFDKFGHVFAIIDCTEIPIQRPSIPKANSQIYSNYKSRPRAKVLVCCAPSGAITFISESAGGAMSDKEMVKRSGFLSMLEKSANECEYQLTVLADRGFNIQDLLLPMNVKLEIPPFLRKRSQLTKKECVKTKVVANARIHIERVIGRFKEFHILKSEMSLDNLDLLDHICTICGSLVNLQPPLVPL